MLISASQIFIALFIALINLFLALQLGSTLFMEYDDEPS